MLVGGHWSFSRQLLPAKRLRGCSMVVVQQSTKALLTLHSSSRLNLSRWRDDQSVRQTLMVSLEVIMSDEFMQRIS